MDNLAQQVRGGGGKKIEMHCNLQELTLRRNMLLGTIQQGLLCFLHVSKVERVCAFDPNCVFKDI